ncbi:SDR family NAD(P)-dependent oxidoreductase [Erwinia billingiae]|uniref:SDR family oxidoreductase n=1 Tax=Erwinia billingiae TaxID=182337 RepID=UPI00320B48C8
MSISVTNCVAVVTGASSGIGEATALKLAELGATVALVARRKERLDALVKKIESAGGKALAVPADITLAENAANAVSQIAQTLGGIDIIVNCAGMMLIGNAQGADLKEWDSMVDINIRGTLYVTHAALPHLLESAEKGSRKVADVINISSCAAHQFTAMNGVYAMTKAGINGFSESLRQEVTQKHVRVGVIEPGSVSTELVSHNNEEIRNKVLAPFFDETETLVPEDVADAVAWMVTRPRHAAVNKLWVGPTEQL